MDYKGIEAIVTDKSSPIEWNSLGDGFQDYIKNRNGSRLVRAIGDYAHCKGCAKSIIREKTRYTFEGPDEQYDEGIIGYVDVPDKFAVEAPALIVFEVSQDGRRYGWIKRLPPGHLSNSEIEEFNQFYKEKLEELGSYSDTIKKRICERLIKSNNPSTRKRAEEILAKVKSQEATKKIAKN